MLPGWSASIPANWVLVNKAGIDNMDPEWQRVARHVEKQPQLAQLVISGRGAVAVRLTPDRRDQSGDVLTFMIPDDLEIALTETGKASLCQSFVNQVGQAMKMKSRTCEVTAKPGAQLFRTTMSADGGRPWSNLAVAKADEKTVIYAIGHFRSDTVDNPTGLASEVRQIVTSMRTAK